MVELGLQLPPGHTLVTYAERPDLDSAIDAHNVGIWQPFMLEDEVANRVFPVAFEAFPEFQLILLDPAGSIVAVANSMPLAWDGTDEGLPAGWDDQVEWSVSDHVGGQPTNTLGAMLIVVRPELRGAGHAGTMLEAFRAPARSAGFGAVIACVRPTE
jgi:hypothetical protein